MYCIMSDHGTYNLEEPILLALCSAQLNTPFRPLHLQSQILGRQYPPLQQFHNDRPTITRNTSSSNLDPILPTLILLVNKVEPTGQLHLPLPPPFVGHSRSGSIAGKVEMKHCIPGHGPAGVIVQLEAGEEVGFVVEGGEECVGCFDGIVGCFAGGEGVAVCFVVDEVGGY